MLGQLESRRNISQNDSTVILVIHGYGSMKKLARRIHHERSCYCAAQRLGSCSVELVPQMWGKRSTLLVPWYETPLHFGAEQNGSSINRPHWPLSCFNKLLAIAVAWYRHPQSSWFWYADLDTRILNYSVDVTSFLPARHDTTANDIGLIVVDSPIGGICAGSYMVRRNAAGIAVLREWWEAQISTPPHLDQGALYWLLLKRTHTRTRAVYTGECEREPWLGAGWRGQTQCFNYWMVQLGHPYGKRSTRDVQYVDPRGSDFQASSYRSYGTRTMQQHRQAYGANPKLPGERNEGDGPSGIFKHLYS